MQAALLLTMLVAAGVFASNTVVEIDPFGTLHWHINGVQTYKGNKHIEGLLMNARLVQGVFDDDNTTTHSRWKYPDTGKWDPMRNTQEFCDHMPDWKAKGLLAFTVGLQGGSPFCYGNQDWIVSAFKADGSLKTAWLDRLHMILAKADEVGMVVIVQYFYYKQFPIIQSDKVHAAVTAITQWLADSKYTNFLVEIFNERCSSDIAPLITLAQSVSKAKGRQFLVTSSCGGGGVPSAEVLDAGDFILVHGNGQNPAGITAQLTKVRNTTSYKATPKPIIYNEDDHGHFDKEGESNMLAAIEGKASWGLLCCCDESTQGDYSTGYQCPPVNWGTTGPCLLPKTTPGNGNKEDFFNELSALAQG